MTYLTTHYRNSRDVIKLQRRRFHELVMSAKGWAMTMETGCLLPPELHGLVANVGQVRKKIRVPEQDGGAGVP